MDGRRIRKYKVADLKISGYVWTGPLQKRAARATRMLALITLHNSGAKSLNMRFRQQTEDTNVNLLFFIFTQKALVPKLF